MLNRLMLTAAACLLCVACPGKNAFLYPTQAQILKTRKALQSERYAPAPSIDDRAFWEALYSPETVEAAEGLLEQQTPRITEEVYLAYSKTGERMPFTSRRRERLTNLSTLALAECMEDDGRFLGKITEYLETYFGMPSWTDSAHDKQLRVYNGELVGVDLFAAENGMLVASVYSMLEPRLEPRLVKELLSQLDRRITRPYLAACRDLEGDSTYSFWWLTSGHNWNSVCTSGVLYTTLISCPSRDTRAEVVACGVSGLEHYLRGFTSDGYCSEGMHYWEFGFGNYLHLGEVLLSHSRGRIDLFDDRLVREVARFPARMALRGDTYPAYSDSKISDKPSYYSRLALARHFGEPSVLDPTRRLEGLLWQVLLNNTLETPPPSGDSAQELRSWYDTANVLVCRSTKGLGGLFASIKSGNNGEFHNHNDVGSYVAMLNGVVACVDPGPEFYTSRTFSKDRYVSNLINSRGHAVPLVDGRMQSVGSEARGRLIFKSFAPRKDHLVIDLTSAYDVPSLERLRRVFDFDRKQQRLEVTDEFSLAEPGAFGTALITYERHEIVSPDVVRIFSEDGSVTVTVKSRGGAVRLTPEVIDENAVAGKKPTRIGVDFEQPVLKGSVSLLYESGE